MMWPFSGVAARPGVHRVIHIWSTRWQCDTPIPWSDAQELRRLAREIEASSGPEGLDCTSFGEVFDHQLRRQYARVRERVPELVGRPEPVKVAHRTDGGDEIWGTGHGFLVRLPSGHLLACLNLSYQARL